MATYIKFMSREDFVKMITEIHRFTMINSDGKLLTCDNRVERPVYENYHGITICWHATAFKLSAFDYNDVLVRGEGYIRYNTWQYGKKESAQGIILREKYGFTRED